jgi:hypothetical protein
MFCNHKTLYDVVRYVDVDICFHRMPNRWCHETVPLLSPALFLDSSAPLSRDELRNIIHPLQVPDNLHNISLDLSSCHKQCARKLKNPSLYLRTYRPAQASYAGLSRRVLTHT